MFTPYPHISLQRNFPYFQMGKEKVTHKNGGFSQNFDIVAYLLVVAL